MGGSVTGPAGLPLATGAIWWQTHEIWSNATRIQNHAAAAWNVKLFDTLPFQDNFTKFSYTLLNHKNKEKTLEFSIYHPYSRLLQRLLATNCVSILKSKKII